jgi:toxin HigB-1
VIRSFGDVATEDLYHGRQSGRTRRFPPDAVPAALRKLDMVNAAGSLSDLRVPPGNRLEALKGDLAGLHSIRVNDRWRIVFRWVADGAEDVSIEDYH